MVFNFSYHQDFKSVSHLISPSQLANTQHILFQPYRSGCNLYDIVILREREMGSGSTCTVSNNTLTGTGIEQSLTFLYLSIVVYTFMTMFVEGKKVHTSKFTSRVFFVSTRFKFISSLRVVCKHSTYCISVLSIRL